jgi:DNA-binding response OmpR family regulator
MEVIYMKILITGLEPELLKALQNGLNHFGLNVDVAGDGNRCYEMICANHYDLAVLDCEVPRMNLGDIAKEIKKKEFNTKILILSDKENPGAVCEKAREIAEDILYKPFDYGELVSKIRSLTKEEEKPDLTVLKCSGLTVDLKNRKVFSGEKERITLTPKEYKILEFLVKNAGVIVSAEDIVNYVWGDKADYSSVSVKVHISKMRKKVSDSLNKDPLLTVRGGGYMFMQGL